jgi:16S rRNA U516 pseudouridylate synthase RsuA-like enzyme
MSETIDPMFPIKGYAFRSFLIHKPFGVVSSTVDTGPTELVKKVSSPRFGLPKNTVARRTVYDVAAKAGFPTDCGLVGRLDLETSGIMVSFVTCLQRMPEFHKAHLCSLSPSAF